MGEGPVRWRVMRNWAADREGSIHHDETARLKGFPSGLVPGDVHVAVVTAELVDRFGKDWYERGFLRHTFVGPVFNGEEVAFVSERSPGGNRQRAVSWRLEKRDGTVACAGSGGLMNPGEDGAPPWHDEIPAAAAGDDYDPLPHEEIGPEYEERTPHPEVGAFDQSLAGNDESEWYRTSSPWGDPIVPTVGMFSLAHRIRPPDMPAVVRREMASGMNASFDALHRGPVFYGRRYRRRAWLAGKGTSGRYAFRVVDFSLVDPEPDREVFSGRWRIKWVTSRPLLERA